MQEIRPKSNLLSYIYMIILCAGVGALSGGLGKKVVIMSYMILGILMSAAIPLINVVTAKMKRMAIPVSAAIGAVFGGISAGVVCLIAYFNIIDIPIKWLLLSGIAYGTLIHLTYSLRRIWGLVYIELMTLIYFAMTLSYMLKFADFLLFREGLILATRTGLSMSLLFSAGWFTAVYLFDPCYYSYRKETRHSKLRLYAFSTILLLLFFIGLPKIFHLRVRYYDLVFRSKNNNQNLLKMLPDNTDLFAGYKVFKVNNCNLKESSFPIKDVMAFSISEDKLAAKTSIYQEVNVFKRGLYNKPEEKLESGGFLYEFSPDGNRLAICENELVKIFDMQNDGELLESINFIAPISNFCWTSSGKQLVLEDDKRKLSLFDIETGESNFFMTGVEPYLMNDGKVAYSDDNKILAADPNAPEVEPKVLYKLPEIQHELLFDFCFSPDEKYICYLYPHQDLFIGSSYIVISPMDQKKTPCVVGTVPQSHWDLDLYWLKKK